MAHMWVSLINSTRAAGQNLVNLSFCSIHWSAQVTRAGNLSSMMLCAV